MNEEMENDAARKARNLCHRIEAAAASTRQMVERGEYGAAYDNLRNIEGFTIAAKVAASRAMLERRWYER